MVQVKKDRLFVIIMALVAGNLFYYLFWSILGLYELYFGNVTASWQAHTFRWGLTITNIVAIWGVLKLIKDYRKRIKNGNVS